LLPLTVVQASGGHVNVAQPSAWSRLQEALGLTAVRSLAFVAQTTETSGPARGSRSFAIKLMRPGSFQITQDLAAGPYVRTYHQGSVHISGIPAPSAEAVGHVREQAARWFVLMLAQTLEPVQLRSLPDQRIDGAITEVMQLDQGADGTMQIFVAPGASRIVQVIRAPRGADTSSGTRTTSSSTIERIAAYRQVGRVSVPERIIQYDGPSTRTIVIGSVVVNPPLSDTDFQPRVPRKQGPSS
jgi:hypothetical protein